MTPRIFPPGFLWGTATSAHQVEGQNTNNQWWDWEQQGRIWNGDTSADACGWWRDVEGDLGRAANLGQNAHRMSIEWSRIEPSEGRFDEAAIGRYREILAAMHRRGITPMITLHHFTNPRWLEAQGGWLSARTIGRFERFCTYAVGALGDLCDLWCTINEPSIFAGMSYAARRWPPGHGRLLNARRVLANMLWGHAAAARAIHRLGSGHQVGLVHNFHLFDPATPAPQDLAMAALYDYLNNQVILHALRTGRIPPPFGNELREVPFLRESYDFFGLNYYSRSRIAFLSRTPRWVFGHMFTPDDVERSDFGAEDKTYGEVYPHGIYRALRRAHHRLGCPIYITETGLPDHDDDQRPRYILNHLAEVHRAIEDGADVRGVFIWSLLDNFEWAEGWGLRFGLYAFDERTGERRLRRSGALYGIIARANAIPAHVEAILPSGNPPGTRRLAPTTIADQTLRSVCERRSTNETA
jgi:beta-glucosidase